MVNSQMTEKIKFVRLLHTYGSNFEAQFQDVKDNVAVKALPVLGDKKSENEIKITEAMSRFYPNATKYYDTFKCKSIAWDLLIDRKPVDKLCQDESSTVDNITYTPDDTYFMVTELIPISLDGYMKELNDEKKKEVRLSVIRQIACLLQIAQDELKFEHGDLFSRNILLRPGDGSITYKVRGKEYTIETHGVIAVIIDFGESTIGSNKRPYYDVVTLWWSLFKRVSELEVRQGLFKEKNDKTLDLFFGSHGVDFNDLGHNPIVDISIPFEPIDLEIFIRNPQEYLIDLFKKNKVEIVKPKLVIPPLE